MPFRIRRKDGPVDQAVRRIAQEQIDRAIRSIDHEDHPQAVHDVRKRCKKLRGLVRLVRPALASYSDENAAFREIARLIATSRDAKVMQDTYDHIVGHYEAEVDRKALGIVRRRITLERKAEAPAEDVGDNLAECRGRLLVARERAGNWSLGADEWEAVSGGLGKTYARARKAADHAREAGDAEAHHELRKRIKYHWYHTRLLRDIWREEMEARAGLASEVSDLLGLHHDITVFKARIASGPDALASAEVIEVITSLANRRLEHLERQAAPRIARLLAEQPDDLVDRWHALWRVWRGA